MNKRKRQKSAGRNQDIASFDADIALLELDLSEHKDRWKADPVTGAFSAFKRTLILERALKIGCSKSFGKRTAFCDELCRVMRSQGNLPQRSSGKGTSKTTGADWSPVTFGNYLGGKNITPETHEMESIADAAAKIASRELAKAGREHATSINLLLQWKFDYPSDCLEQILANLIPATSDDFWAEPPFVSVFGPGFEGEPRAGWPTPLEEWLKRSMPN